MLNPLNNTLDYSLKINGINANVNGTITKVLLKENDLIISKTPLSLGNLITINNTKFLVVSTDTPLSQSVYYKAKIKMVDKVIINGLTTYSYVTFDKINETTTSAFTIEKNKYKFIIPNMSIKVNDNIIFKNDNYTVDVVDNTNNGILVIYATYSGAKDEFKINLTNNHSSIKVNDTYQIEYTCTKNGATVENPTVTFKSNDESIATVSENGLITGIAEGETTISCTYEDSIVVFSVVVEQAITLTPIKVVMENNADTVKKGNSRTVYVYIDDGVDGSKNVPTGRTFSFSFDSDTTDGGYAKITSTTDTSCVVTGLVADNYCEIIAKDNADNSITNSYWFYVSK